MPEPSHDDVDDEFLDTDEVEFDEDPDLADIERLDHEGAVCPDCGAEVWDGAEVCPKCQAYLGGDAPGRAPAQPWFLRPWPLIIIIAMLIIGVIFGCWL